MWIYQKKSTPNVDSNDEVNDNHDKFPNIGKHNEGDDDEERKEYANSKSEAM